MKFPAEKKSTLCIYTEAAPTDKLAGISAAGPAPGAEAMNGASAGLGPGSGPAEAAALRKELEGARAALRRQEARCRLLVAALGARLREREAAARAERALRDRQLAGVLRALTALEARLRQEQRLIRRQLVERDATISAQAEELRRLRASQGAAEEEEECEQPERFRWPGEEGGSAGDDPPAPPRPSFALHRSARTKAHGVAAPAPPTSAAAAAAAAARRESEATLLRFRPTLNGSAAAAATVAAAELDCSALDSDSGVFHGSDGSDSSLRSDEAAAGGGGCCADEEPDDDLPAPARDLAKHYAHNPVLECVSQILLRDRDEAGSPPAHAHPPPPPPQGAANGRRRAPPPPALWPSIREERESLADDADDADAEEAPSPPPPPAPPARAQHLQERACALLTRRLTVVSHPDLEQVDDAAQCSLEGSPPPPSPPSPSTHHLHVHAHGLSHSHSHNHNHNHGHGHGHGHKAHGAPPAVPPKPPQLGALGRLRRRAPARSQTSNSPTGSAPAAGGSRPHRQILSNGSLLKAAAERGGGGGAGVSVAAVAAPAPVGARARGVGPVATRVQRQLESRPAAIRVGSSVSSLITGAAGGSIVNELARDRHPDALHSHFEEFRLEDVDISEAEDRERERERERASGDGAAPLPVPAPAPMGPAAAAPPAPVPALAPTGPAPAPAPAAGARGDATTYESFLEATGLSQKPLLTPSRMLSNHRSVLKPKDVKLRSRAARAAAGTPSGPPDRPAPVVRYWVEPFL